MRSCATLAALTACAVAAAGPTWTKTVIDDKFRSEGVAVGDVNRDGKPDVLVGDLWYEAPDWEPHPIRNVGDYGDGSRGYSLAFAVFADDINKDGWVDQIVVGFPGKPCHWYENPKNSAGPWKKHEIWHSACNETPLYADLLGTGDRVLVMGFQPKGAKENGNMGQMAWFRPGDDPTKTWTMHPVSRPSTPKRPVPGTFRYAHGLGVGDVNGDGRSDVICPAGWWERPAEETGKPWMFHKAVLGAACADMVTYDLTGDGKAEVVSSSAHRFGIWAYDQRAGGAFLKRDLFAKLLSQSHALCCTDIDGDGLKDLVTGKRWWAHGPRGDVAPMADPVIYWFEAKKASDGTVTFTPHMIDKASGIGTQFTVADVNGDRTPDIVTSNKRGVFLFTQTR